MGSKKQMTNMKQRINPYQGTEREQYKQVEKQSFIACIVALAGLPLALIGFGMILGIIGLVLGIKARRPDGKRSPGAIAAIVAGVLSIILGIPGCIVFYGTYINPGSEFVQNLVNLLVESANLIL